jgi:PKD repeat protein
MKRSIVLLTLLLIFNFTLKSQTVRTCGTMDLYNQEMLKDPTLKQKRQILEQQIENYIKRNNGRRDSTVIVIPVVVHVVHNGQQIGFGPNLTDSQVISQIQVLNEDFRRMNADTVNTPGIFRQFAADTRIEFCLATVDPSGNPTNGIHRYNGGQANWSSGIQNILKPATIWNRDNYLNIWSVDFGGSGLLGYAQFPGGAKNTDGVVIGYQYMGRAPYNPVPGRFNLGRTTTHEVGHWLGLYHIWGDGNCNVDDGVNDTPLAGQANYGCNDTTNSCVGTPVDYYDMVQNYMDYTDDDCMNIFTTGQANRMHAAIHNSRASLLTSPGCKPLFSFAYTGKVIDSVTGMGIPYAKVRFQSTNFDLETTADSAGDFTFPNFFISTYDIYAGQWGYLTKYYSSISIDTVSSPFVAKLNKGYYDDFVLEFNWTVVSTATTGNWVRDVPAGTDFNGVPANPGNDIPGDFGEKAFITGNGGGSAGTDDVDGGYTLLTSPYFDATIYSQPYIEFFRWFYNGGGSSTPDDKLIIMLSDGTNLDTLEVADVNDPDLSKWVNRKYKISDYRTPSDSMRLVVYTSDMPNAGHLVEAGIDVFKIVDSAVSGLLPVASFEANDTVVCEGTVVQFTNLSSNQPFAFQWQFTGGNPSTSTAQNPQVTYATAGDYSVTLKVTNSAGSDSLTIISYIHVKGNPKATLVKTSISCFGGNDGAISVNVSNGQAPFTYVWSTNDTTSGLTNLSAGSYIVTITDANGCVGQRGTFVTQPTEIMLAHSSTPETAGKQNGTATSNPSGGTPPYSYLWSDPTAQTTKKALNLAAGTYYVTVTDKNGCFEMDTVNVGTVVGLEDQISINNFSAYPNPTDGRLNINIVLNKKMDVEIRVLNMIGQVMLQENRNDVVELNTVLDLSQLSNGMYMLQVTAGDGQMIRKIHLEH